MDTITEDTISIKIDKDGKLSAIHNGKEITLSKEQESEARKHLANISNLRKQSSKY
jgi:hypothetical protein